MSDSLWPVPKFNFHVTFGDRGEATFQEVSGLDTEHDVIEYRAGNSIDFSTVRMPGSRKTSDVTLKRGFFASGTAIDDYFMEVKMNTITRQTVTIRLLDEEEKAMFTWTLANAWPMKVSGTDLRAEDGQIAVEEIVLAYEAITMEQG